MYHAVVIIAVLVRMLSVALTKLWFAKMKVSHAMYGPHEDSDIIFGPITHFAWT